MDAQQKFDRAKIVISDCHLAAGRFFEGRFNPHEDFHYDEEMAAMFDYFSFGLYSENEKGPVEVELVINGDFLDYLNVPYFGEFEEAITEEVALYKTEAIFKGHPKVMEAIRRFSSKPGKKVTYLIGNHDAELCFEKVRERITREWDAEGRYPSPNVKVVGEVDRLEYHEHGLEIHHGNQFEAIHELDFEQPFIERSGTGEKILNLPWGSFYVLKIINRLKWERESIDKIRPVKFFVFIGLILDPIFTLKFVFLSMFYFLKTRISFQSRKLSGWKNTMNILKQETRFFLDLEREARQFLDQSPKVRTVLFGHTHRPMHKVYGDGKQYLNTGTWTRMVDFDWKILGNPFRRSFALLHLIDPKDGKPGETHAELRQWIGETSPHRSFTG